MESQTQIPTEPSVGILILSAGASTRLGRPKQLLVLNGETLIRRAAKTALESPYRPVVVVLGALAGDIGSEIADLPITPTINDQWAVGMSSSIRAGMKQLSALAPNLEAILMLLCDQPFVTHQLIEDLVRAYVSKKPPVIACYYGNQLGVPALFDRSLFSELEGLTGMEGAKKVIQRHTGQTQAIPFPEGIFDVDTEAEYEKIRLLIDKSSVQ